MQVVQEISHCFHLSYDHFHLTCQIDAGNSAERGEGEKGIVE